MPGEKPVHPVIAAVVMVFIILAGIALLLAIISDPGTAISLLICVMVFVLAASLIAGLFGPDRKKSG